MNEAHRQLRTVLDETLHRVLPPPCGVALVGRPDHSNVGDHAIWLGALAWLRTHGYQIRYASSRAGYSEDALRRALDRGLGAILLSGGGNLGDVWPREQDFRVNVIQAFAEVPAVQLPQSVHFDDQAGLEHFVQLARSHAAFHVLVRDTASAARLEAHGLSTTLAPDMAFTLDPPKRMTPAKDVVWLIRSDHESMAQGHRLDAVDWSAPDELSRRDAARRRWALRTRQFARSGRLGEGAHGLAANNWSRNRVRYGLRLLGAGEFVVTDRLHGLILSVLLHRPTVFLDNSYGKNSAFAQTWLADVPWIRPAQSIEDAQVQLRALQTEYWSAR